MPLSTPLKPSYRVAIVGAGVAGLTAARELLTSKRLTADELIVLEATNRIGGRVQSLSFGSDATPVVIEVGAAWIHGASEGNAFFRDVVVPAGIDYKVVSDRNPWLHPVSCPAFALYAGDDRLSDEDVAYAWTVSEALLATLKTYATTDELVDQYGDESVQHIVDELLSREGVHTEDEYSGSFRQLVASHPRGRVIVAFCLVLIECWMGGTADSLQLEDFEEVDLIGDDPGAHCLVTYGMEQTIKQLASPIERGVIRNNVPVKGIEYSTDDGVTLHVGEQSIHVDHVIVTCSLGALKAGKIAFTPALPAEKLGAINRSEMGQYMKILLEFPTVFWPKETQFFGQVLPQHTRENTHGLKFPLVMNYFKVKGAPMLEAVLFGKDALVASDVDDSVIVDAFVSHLRQLFGDSVQQPVNHFITRWDKDPWAVGAYSYLTLESSTADPDLLRQTVAGRVLFAGEATNMEYQGSLQAAYLSGLQAVAELDSLWKSSGTTTADKGNSTK